MKKIIFLMLSVALIATCTGKKQNNASGANTEEKQLVEQTASEEDFNTFFAKFKADSVFQKSRIQFPLPSKTYNDEEASVEQIAEKEWKYSDFHWDESYATRSENAYTQDIVLEGNTATLKYSGVENGINIQSIFERKNGKWYFTTVEDRSM